MTYSRIRPRVVSNLIFSCGNDRYVKLRNGRGQHADSTFYETETRISLFAKRYLMILLGALDSDVFQRKPSKFCCCSIFGLPVKITSTDRTIWKKAPLLPPHIQTRVLTTFRPPIPSSPSHPRRTNACPRPLHPPPPLLRTNPQKFHLPHRWIPSRPWRPC